jgi:hypothetical protein
MFLTEAGRLFKLMLGQQATAPANWVINPERVGPAPASCYAEFTACPHHLHSPDQVLLENPSEHLVVRTGAH